MSKPLFQTPQSLHSSSCLGLDLNLDLDLDLNHWHKWAQLSRTANPEKKEKNEIPDTDPPPLDSEKIVLQACF